VKKEGQIDSRSAGAVAGFAEAVSVRPRQQRGTPAPLIAHVAYAEIAKRIEVGSRS
jgi:hypothetical protein